jgi:hypothetical protein
MKSFKVCKIVQYWKMVWGNVLTVASLEALFDFTFQHHCNFNFKYDGGAFCHQLVLKTIF